jgi:hypothetical protein
MLLVIEWFNCLSRFYVGYCSASFGKPFVEYSSSTPVLTSADVGKQLVLAPARCGAIVIFSVLTS